MKFNNKKGVTLLELIAVSSIIAIIALIGFTSFDSVIKEQNTTGCVNQAAYAIKQARHYAEIKGVKTELRFPVNSNTYVVKTADQVLSNKDLADSFSGVLPEGTKIISNTCSGSAIYFYIDGTPVDSSGKPITTNCKITFGYDVQPQKSLTLVAISGNIIYDK